MESIECFCELFNLYLLSILYQMQKTKLQFLENSLSHMVTKLMLEIVSAILQCVLA